MVEDLAWLLLLPIGALLIAASRRREGPVLRIPDGGDRSYEGAAPPSSTWPIGAGPRGEKGA